MRYLTHSFLLLGVLFGSTRGENLNGKSGSFTSGGYPEPYAPDADKAWNITVLDGYCVRLIFTVFDLEDSYENDTGWCVYDYVKVDDGPRMCGNAEKRNPNAPGPYKIFRSPGNTMMVRLVSDYSNDDPNVGFEAHFRAEDRNECHELREKLNSGEKHWDELIYCNHFCHNVPASYYCSCRFGFTLHDNKHTCTADCSTSILTGDNGTLSSPDYPKPYSKLSNCQRIIEVGLGREVEVKFDPVFDIEEHYQEGCAYDWIKFILPNTTTVKYCGSVAPNNGSWINLHFSSVIVEFHSDMAIEKAGYKLEYRAKKQRCHSEIVGALNNGSVIDLNDQGFHEHGDFVMFSCNVGYNLVGSSRSSCQAGNWFPPPPTCQIVHCPRPEHLLNIDKTVVQNVDNIQLHFNYTIVINCIEWYRMASGSQEWFCNHNATWQPRDKSSILDDDNIPICEPQCGVKTQVGGRTILTPNIIGGKFSRFAEWPWMAFLDLKNKGLETKSFCAGSLLHERYVVTAAHCVMWGPGFFVYLGVTDRSNSSNPHMQVFTAEEVYLHNNFSNSLDEYNIMDSDIAVIKLNASAVIGRYVRPICLPRSDRRKNLPQLGLLDSPEYQTRGVIAGWGITEYGVPSLRLKQTRVPFFNHTTCRRVFARSKRVEAVYTKTKINHNMFCAGFFYKSRDSCNGDSGGPLMYRDLRNNRWYLNGIVSFGTSRNCTPVNVLGVYTKVGNYISFLDDYII